MKVELRDLPPDERKLVQQRFEELAAKRFAPSPKKPRQEVWWPRAPLDGRAFPEGIHPPEGDTTFNESARLIGAKVMRVVGSSLMFRNQPHGPQIKRLTGMFREAVRVAENYGIRMAVENHIDFTADEMLQLLTEVGSPWLGINFDTGNFLRLLDDPIKGMAKLAPYVYATHIKDLKVQKGVAADEWYFFSSTPVGEGVVDNGKLVQLLADAGYDGLLAVEIDFLHPDYGNDEDQAVARSVAELKRLADSVRVSRSTLR